MTSTATTAAPRHSPVPAMTGLADFRRLAVEGSRWHRCGPRVGSAICTVTHAAAGRVPRFRGIHDDASTFTRARLDLPPAPYLRFDGDTMHVLADPRDPTAIVVSWRYLGRMPVPPQRPPAGPGPRVVCRVDRLQPGDVVYGPAELAGPGAGGFTVTAVDLTTQPATVHTREQWPLRYAPWQLLVTVPDGRPERCHPVPVRPRREPARVYLTVNTVAWLGRPDLADMPKCISRNRLAGYRGRRIPRSLALLLLDSGGFTELKDNGGWRQDAQQFVDEVRGHVAQLGPDRVVAVAQQDWMCETEVINGGHTKDGRFVGTRWLLDPHWRLSLDEMVALHQRLTVDNLVQLRRLAPDLPIIAVLQGQTLQQYLRHMAMFEAAGVRFGEEPLVGLGSVCRRQGTQQTARIVRALAAFGLRLHGFGVGAQGLSLYGREIVSTDSNAFSYHGRRLGLCPHGAVRWEANCPVNARSWWVKAQARLARATPRPGREGRHARLGAAARRPPGHNEP
ncbi:DUF7221 family queuine tRNA-ribosyltransferase-like protein [Actinoplanes sp. G11-F43]|uniref:deazapurine DNA modification protein DpdA family protein n=1 Tax=Actinoplanes sp. G11-F43 TaxID=3424130 RepID=UPI003D346AD1